MTRVEHKKRSLQGGFRPIPDEEGTEIVGPRSYSTAVGSRFRPIPDEEGTEMFRFQKNSLCGIGFRPIPDEEGTEISGLPAESASVAELQTDPR